ncbi:PDR/VanB family oxidoreductase [Pseudonocardia parietis]|uniref:Ferredoxin-NADP reductase n=1 Tax=Pseudonocardia parietis TaxID=570936 RepID=A0ABS4W788_9PSEU|nr:PDR/VanB family oxidoreductase [Pseudonocardia parietis]MBP2372076.1 ferredoxin-NADP reductase [Pseudonocardia parietis]
MPRTDSRGPSDDLDMVVLDKRTAADGVVVVELEHEGGDELPAWSPGAHVDLVLDDDLVRQYSLCGDPGNRRSWRIGVLRKAGGRGGSLRVHDDLQTGDKVRCRGPRNNFELVEAAEYVFVAGGIGITPILPMIAECAAAERPWRLAYGGRARESMAFVDELEQHGNRVTLWPQDRAGLIDLATELGASRPDVAVYCCGPEPLIDAVDEHCGTWPPGSLHVERFRPAAVVSTEGDTAFEVVCDYSDVIVGVLPGMSVVQALRDAGVDVPTSCGEGTCGTCETVVLDGVPDHRDSYLTAEEHASNEVMTPCCSRSCTPRLVLDL